MACTDCNNSTITVNGEEINCKGCEVRDREVMTYLGILAPLMGLEGWAFEIMPEPCGVDNMAEIDTVYGQRYAKVSLSKDWDNFDAKMQRDTLVHELMHAHLAPLTELSYDLVDEVAAKKNAAKVAKTALYYAEERVVDVIAVAWAINLPLPGGAE